MSYRGSVGQGSVSTIASTVRSEVYQEHLRKKQHRKINKVTIGPGSRQFKYAVGFGIFGCIVFAVGAILLGLNLGQKHLFDAPGNPMEFLGPALVVIGILILAIAGYFFYRARVKSDAARRDFKFRPSGTTNVAVVDMKYSHGTEGLKSGSTTNAANRTSGSFAQTPYSSGYGGGSVNEFPYATPTASVHSGRPGGAGGGYRRPVSHTGSYGRKTGGGSHHGSMNFRQPEDDMPSFARPAPSVQAGFDLAPPPPGHGPQQISPSRSSQITEADDAQRRYQKKQRNSQQPESSSTLTSSNSSPAPAAVTTDPNGPTAGPPVLSNPRPARESEL